MYVRYRLVTFVASERLGGYFSIGYDQPEGFRTERNVTGFARDCGEQ